MARPLPTRDRTTNRLVLHPFRRLDALQQPQAGEGRIVSCLRKNEARLNEKCTAALKETGLWDLGK